MIATSAAWFVDALAARKSYASEFYASLRQGYLDLTSPLVDFTPDQVSPKSDFILSDWFLHYFALMWM